MNRNLSLVIALSFAAATSTPLLALGLGEVEVHSRLSAPLRATLPLTDVDGVDPRRMRVALADETAFEQAGLSRGLMARGIDFSIERHAGELVVAMRSEQPVQDPFLDLLLDIDWPDGRVLRQVTLLLDPPGYEDSPVLAAGAAARVAETSVPPSAMPSAAAAPQPSVVPVAGGSDDPAAVRSGDTLWAVASRLRPGSDIDISQMMLALVEANPDAFPSGNINSMRAGVTLDVPSREAITRRSTSEAGVLVQAQSQAWATRQSDGVAVVAASALSVPAAQAEAETVYADEQPRLTLLSDDGLASEQGTTAASDEQALDEAAQIAGLAVAGDAEQVAGNAEQGAGADAYQYEGDADERVLRLETVLLASQQALGNIERQRDQLQQEVREMRDQLAQHSAAGIPSAQAGGVGVTPPATSPASEPEPWWGALWQQLRDGSLTAASLALAALLALWALVRRRREGGSALRAGQRYVDGAAVMPSVNAPSHVEAAAAVVAEASPQSEAGTSTEQQPMARPIPQAEAISEADIFMAYGRYDQARELLETSLGEQPQRQDLRLKLLTVHAEQGDWGAVEREAEVLRGVDDPSLQAEVERLMARRQPNANSAIAEMAAEADHPVEPDPEPVTPPPAPMGSGESLRVIDYRPPSLEPSAPREETPMQPSVEFEPGGAAPPGEGASVENKPVEEEWEVEEVAFEPLHLDNEQSAAASPQGLLNAARQRFNQGQPQAARALVEQALAEAQKDTQLEAEARRLIAQYDL